VFNFESRVTSGTILGYHGENGWSTSSVIDRFSSLDADGFTIAKGSDTANHILNSNGTTMLYLALAGDDVATGSYTGNASDNRNITGVGFQPVWMLIMNVTQHSVMKFDSSGASTDTTAFTYNGANVANAIQALQSDGFQVGMANQVNQSSVVHHWCAIKAGPKVYQARYTGNNTDNRDITGVGFQPDAIFIKRIAARNFGWRSSNHTGDNSKYYRSTGFVANYIQSFLSDGFQIGNAADINTSSDSLDYIAFTQGLSTFTPRTAYFM